MNTPPDDPRSIPQPHLLAVDAEHYRQLLAQASSQALPYSPPPEGSPDIPPTPPTMPPASAYTPPMAAPPAPGSYPTGAPPSNPWSTGTPVPAQSASQGTGGFPSEKRSTGGRGYLQYLIVGGCLITALTLIADVQSLIPSAPVPDLCQETVSPDAVLSRTHLAQLLAVSERSNKATVRQVVSEPYCRLPSLELRAGVVAEREAYPLAFDPDTWFIVLYEGDEYAGFDFSFRR